MIPVVVLSADEAAGAEVARVLENAGKVQVVATTSALSDLGQICVCHLPRVLVVCTKGAPEQAEIIASLSGRECQCVRGIVLVELTAGADPMNLEPVVELVQRLSERPAGLAAYYV